MIKSRTIRRQVKPDKYNTQAMDIINSTPWTTPSAGSGFVLTPKARATQHKQQTTSSTSAETQTRPQPEQQLSTPTTAMTAPSRTITDLPMATAPPAQQRKTPLPTPASREVTDEISEGSAAKQQKTEERTIATRRPNSIQEPAATRMRVSAVTVKTRKGETIKAVSIEDEQEKRTEKILLEPWVTNTEGLDKAQTIEGVKQEVRSMKSQQLYTETHFSHLNRWQRSKVVKSRWVLRQEGNTARARIAAEDSHRRRQGQRWHLRLNTHLLYLETSPHTGVIQQLDRQNKRHFNSLFAHQSGYNRSVHASSSRVLQPAGSDRAEAQQSQLTAEPLSRNTPTAEHAAPCQWTQRVQSNKGWCTHPMLCGRPSVPWRSNGSQQALYGHLAALDAQANRRSYNRQHSQLPRKEHQQQRWLLWNQPPVYIHNAT